MAPAVVGRCGRPSSVDRVGAAASSRLVRRTPGSGSAHGELHSRVALWRRADPELMGVENRPFVGSGVGGTCCRRILGGLLMNPQGACSRSCGAGLDHGVGGGSAS